MKKLLLLAMSLFLAGMVSLGCGDVDDDDDDNGNDVDACADVSGTYDVDKEATVWNCDDIPEIQLSDIYYSSELEINQLGCDLLGVEDGFILYTGESFDEEYFELWTENPEDVAIPVTLQVGSTTLECEFNADVLWMGFDEGDGELSGEIEYQLDIHPDETDPNCPSWCDIEMDFQAEEN